MPASTASTAAMMPTASAWPAAEEASATSAATALFSSVFSTPSGPKTRGLGQHDVVVRGSLARRHGPGGPTGGQECRIEARVPGEGMAERLRGRGVGGVMLAAVLANACRAVLISSVRSLVAPSMYSFIASRSCHNRAMSSLTLPASWAV